MNDIDMYMPRGGVQGHAGQSTMVEASRAVEEVRAKIIVARQFPRDVQGAIRQIEETFSVPQMADRSFFSYSKGKGKPVTGPTIHLAKAVAQAWGNIRSGVWEMSRLNGQSEMRAWAWDMQTNQEAELIFIVEHAIDTRDGRKELTDQRSIYENNANMGNRRLRAALESVIPAYVFDIAKDVAAKTLRDGGGMPLAVRVVKALQAFSEFGVEPEQIEQERGRERGKWTDIDMAHLRVVIGSLRNGEITADDVFPPRALQVADVAPVVPPQPAQAVPAMVDVPLSDAYEGDPWPEVAQPGGGE